MATIVRQEKYIKSDVGNNNNKFWYISLFDNGDVLTEWGRIGDKGQSKTFPNAGVGFLEKKCREKESCRNDEIPYRKLNVIASSASAVTTTNKTVTDAAIKDIAKKQIKTNNPTVTRLIEYLTAVNAHNITEGSGGKIVYNDTTGLFSTPLGIVTQSNIDEANRILLDIGNYVAGRKYNTQLNNLTNDYLMLIPCDFGHKRLDVKDFWSDLGKVQYQKSILDSLQASLDSALSQPTDSKTTNIPEKKFFDVELNMVSDRKVIDKIYSMYYKSKKSHSCSYLKPTDIYEIRIGKMSEEFKNDGAKMDNVWELWHGSSCSNLLSIMSKGFMIPPRSSANVTGRMFSDGVYASNISTKALGYSTGYWGKSSHNRYFMFLLDMAMGKFFVPGPSDNLPKSGYDSTFAKPGYSGIQNEEMIVYRTSQCNPKYLIEFK